MIENRYAKIINEVTYEVQVGVGCPVEYYIEIGMELMDVEQAYNGLWYVAGHTPLKPEPTPEEIKEKRIAELKGELSDTDYVVIKIAESDNAEEQAQLREHYAEVIVNRKAWRAEINELESGE